MTDPRSPEARRLPPASEDILTTVERSPTLTGKVYERLKRGLLDGLWEPGQKITARQLSRDLGVSLTPAREAMMQLATEGALQVSESRVFTIPVLGRAAYGELIKIRLALEPLAIEAATPGMTDDFVGELGAINEAMRDHIQREQFDEALRLDSLFHLSIYDRSGLPTLRAIIESLWLRAGPTRRRLSLTFRKRLIGFENHKRIIAALAARDAAAARAALAQDLSDGSAAILAVLED
jgi:GntR family transcriptional regulator, colanic acid and biofilm gene transcriptional regulator